MDHSYDRYKKKRGAEKETFSAQPVFNDCHIRDLEDYSQTFMEVGLCLWFCACLSFVKLRAVKHNILAPKMFSLCM